MFCKNFQQLAGCDGWDAGCTAPKKIESFVRDPLAITLI